MGPAWPQPGGSEQGRFIEYGGLVFLPACRDIPGLAADAGLRQAVRTIRGARRGCEHTAAMWHRSRFWLSVFATWAAMKGRKAAPYAGAAWQRAAALSGPGWKRIALYAVILGFALGNALDGAGIIEASWAHWFRCAVALALLGVLARLDVAEGRARKRWRDGRPGDVLIAGGGTTRLIPPERIEEMMAEIADLRAWRDGQEAAYEAMAAARGLGGPVRWQPRIIPGGGEPA